MKKLEFQNPLKGAILNDPAGLEPVIVSQ